MFRPFKQFVSHQLDTLLHQQGILMSQVDQLQTLLASLSAGDTKTAAAVTQIAASQTAIAQAVTDETAKLQAYITQLKTQDNPALVPVIAQLQASVDAQTANATQLAAVGTALAAVPDAISKEVDTSAP